MFSSEATIIPHMLDRLDILCLIRGLTVSSDVAIKLNLSTKYNLGLLINNRIKWAEIQAESWKPHSTQTLYNLYKVLRKTIDYHMI